MLRRVVAWQWSALSCAPPRSPAPFGALFRGLGRGPRGWCPALVTAVEGDGRISLVCFRDDFGAAEWHASVLYGRGAQPEGAEPNWRTLADARADATAQASA